MVNQVKLLNEVNDMFVPVEITKLITVKRIYYKINHINILV